MEKSSRKYIENVAHTLMGQLNVTEDSVGLDSYDYDLISTRIRQKLFMRVFQDIRHMKIETLAHIATCGIVGKQGCQNGHTALKRLKSGEDHCTMSHVHGWDEAWLERVKLQKPEIVIRHMAASAIVAAMYDITIRSRGVAT